MRLDDTARVSRLELLKLSPLLLLGGFAIPGIQGHWLDAGVGWSDRVAGLLFREG